MLKACLVEIQLVVILSSGHWPMIGVLRVPPIPASFAYPADKIPNILPHSPFFLFGDYLVAGSSQPPRTKLILLRGQPESTDSMQAWLWHRFSLKFSRAFCGAAATSCVIATSATMMEVMLICILKNCVLKK
ncbi:hypothetical protein FB567DRAFT_515498 [Paraphoma chrysanthemicola]|uniref:Uncharacterized protein n=1 Tax=Paraphoma chrysanthemicola TaxID=798071 RepID=A0A8K0RHI5_9PLEO|nr:hypothetical protein FB567DRAFT_515498 [Paraphoma chrysanthemicola]